MASFETTSSTVPILSIAELEHEPHAVYRKFRELFPFVRSEVGSYLMLRADDVVSLCTDARTRQIETELIRLREINDGPIWDFVTNSMLFANGDTHRRRRAPLAKSFGFRLVSEWRPMVRTVVNQILDRLETAKTVNFLEEFASLLPARIIATILGLPEEDTAKFTDAVFRFTPMLTGSWTKADVPSLEQAARDLRSYVKYAIETRRDSQGGNFLNQYIEANSQSGELTEEEIVTQLMLLIIGGSDTTRCALVVQLSLLMQHRKQWDLLKREPGLVPGAVLECLRYEPSLASVPRFSTSEIQFDRMTLPENSVCVLITMSALRDPKWYQDPERFDITRDQPRWHPVFGGGVHRCLGEALAKVELEEAILAMLSRFPDAAPAGPFPKLQGHTGIRKVDEFSISMK